MIDDLWASLRQRSLPVQKRVDETHPLDLYADFQPPDRPGLLLLTNEKPPERPCSRAISIYSARRSDGRWALRLSLSVPALQPVFAELCKDIVESTRHGVAKAASASALLDRVERWRSLLDLGVPTFSSEQARGLLGELAVLHWIVLREYDPEPAVAAWIGPLRQPHDFLLPTGQRFEVKAVSGTADTVCINGLDQLESEHDPLMLMAVRLEDTALGAPGALTLCTLIESIKQQISTSLAAASLFDRLLSLTGWDAEKSYSQMVVRITAIEGYEVDSEFPRLTRSRVPIGIVGADYRIRLPGSDVSWDLM